jgi:uncharacterized membrane protein (UPF0182 family)
MYTLIILLLLAVGCGLAWFGWRRDLVLLRVLGVLIVLADVLLFGLLDVWGEYLWFSAIGYEARFWTALTAQVATVAAGGVLALLPGLAFGRLLPAGPRRWLPALALAFLGAMWGLAAWQEVLVFLHRVPSGISEPIFGLDAGFYLFTLPLLESLRSLLWIVAVGLAGMTAVHMRLLVVQRQDLGTELRFPGAPPAIAAAFLLLVLAYGRIMERFELLYSPLGVVNGPGWTDVHVISPALVVVAVLCVALAAGLIAPGTRRRMGRIWRRVLPAPFMVLAPLASAGGVLVVVWWLGTIVAPMLTQWLVVEPSELTYERPYIEHNIELTRHAYGLAGVEEESFAFTEDFSRQTVENNRELFENIRLWDWRALDAVYKQFQEIRLYYEFVDVDVDRYEIGGDYRQVMVSAREMEIGNLPADSQTFVNRRFKYTHGYGLTMTGVNEFTPEGLPRLLIKDIPPVTTAPELEVRQPRIYYGELTDNVVVVNSREEEFDYPSGEENMYFRYDGPGGVELSSLWRKFLFGWKFDGTTFFLSSYPTRESRVMFHRTVRERVGTLAPFLSFDADPYLVLHDGRLKWIQDAYTISDGFPYSEDFTSAVAEADPGPAQVPFVRREGRVNYVRNSVKAVVDAYTGEVDFYVFDAEDPILRVWRAIYPELFTERDAMPEGLEAHVRYPADLLLVQGLVHAKYHMQDSTVFYNQEDLWVRATEKYYGRVVPMEPYYIMWEPPGSDETQFILMLPFTPKNRQVLIGWIAGMCDGENYGRYLAYRFPKERRVLGPQQVETKIDQDPVLSQRLTLWDQRGSKVVRGNVLAIPLDKTLIYVEPIYLQAETAAYPELRLVVVMQGDNLSYAEDFQTALEGLFGEAKPEAELDAAAAPGVSGSIAKLTAQAQAAFERYLRLQGERNFAGAGEALRELSNVLTELEKRTKGGE